MQFYLDNVQSTATDSQMAMMAEQRGKTLGINENLARELMELHTLGVDGGYTQKDVQELARIITGAGAWVPRMSPRALERAGAERQGLYLFDPRRHDGGAKTLLGQSFPAGHGADEIDRALHLLATNPATARHISRELALRCMSDNPSDATVKAMTKAFLNSGGKISSTLFAMMQTPEFAQSLDNKTKFKEPLDQLLSDARAACQDQPIGNGELLVASAIDAGQAPFMKTTPHSFRNGHCSGSCATRAGHQRQRSQELQAERHGQRKTTLHGGHGVRHELRPDRHHDGTGFGCNTRIAAGSETEGTHRCLACFT